MYYLTGFIHNKRIVVYSNWQVKSVSQGNPKSIYLLAEFIIYSKMYILLAN